MANTYGVGFLIAWPIDCTLAGLGALPIYLYFVLIEVPLPNESERLARLSAYRSRLILLAKRHGTPCYVFDANEARKNLKRFRESFSAHGCKIETYYAVKSNPSARLLKTLVLAGAGLDVSSVRELALARQAGASKIVYTGPGKTERDFEQLLAFKGEFRVHLESYTEIKRLSRVAGKKKRRINCAIRVHTSAQAGWTKFGVALKALAATWRQAAAADGVRPCGIHFHISHVDSPQTYLRALSEVTDYAMAELRAREREQVEFIDIGGGFCPASFDGLYNWNTNQRVDYDLFPKQARRALRPGAKPFWKSYGVTPIEEFGQKIADFFDRKVRKVFPNARLFAEPGRFISHSCEHFLMRVLDKKDKHTIIVDAGNNMVGWEEHYQFLNYAPVFNLTRFRPNREFGCLIYGPLCTPGDMWGYYLRGARVEIDDLLVMPYQGAYTLTLAQNFIRGVPQEISL